MKSRSRSNNFIELLIALILIAIGIALGVIHRQSESKQEKATTPVTSTMDTVINKHQHHT